MVEEKLWCIIPAEVKLVDEDQCSVAQGVECQDGNLSIDQVAKIHGCFYTRKYTSTT